MALSMSSSSPSTMRNSTMSDIAGKRILSLMFYAPNILAFTGISLSVDKYGDESAHVLTFYKNKTDAVIIGRRSSASSKPSSDEHDRALFRCPVISRRHAKITFTQYGNVRLVSFYLCGMPPYSTQVPGIHLRLSLSSWYAHPATGRNSREACTVQSSHRARRWRYSHLWEASRQGCFPRTSGDGPCSSSIFNSLDIVHGGDGVSPSSPVYDAHRGHCGSPPRAVRALRHVHARHDIFRIRFLLRGRD